MSSENTIWDGAPASRSCFGGVIVGGEFINGQHVGGIHYTAEEWAAKVLNDRLDSMDRKLDLIMKALGIEEG